MIRKIIRERTHRLPREYYCGQIWTGFTVCVEAKQMLFTDCKTVNNFVSILDWARKRNDCVVLLYCFMPEHLHLLLQGQSEKADLYQAMLDFKQKSGFYLRQSRHPHRMQKNFHDHIIRAQKDLSAQLRYVAENPVRRGLVAHWQDYPFTGVLGVDIQTVMDLMLDC